MANSNTTAKPRVIFRAFYVLCLWMLYVVLRYIGGFSSRQSVVLILLLSSLDYVLELSWKCGFSRLKRLFETTEEVKAEFSPYSVWVQPKWFELLLDFKLIDSTEEFQRLREEAKRSPSPHR